MVPPIKACVVLLVLCAMGISPSVAQAQTQLLQGTLIRKQKGESGNLDFLFKVSEWTLREGTALDAIGTRVVIDHPTVARRTDGSVLGYFYGKEEGWAGPIVGRRDASGAIAANILLNIGVDLLSQKLYRRGGRLRFLALGLRLWKSTDSTMAGVHNLRFNAGINDRLRVATGYRGRIIWSNKAR